MPILLRNIPLGLDQAEEDLVPLAARRLHVPPRAIRNYAVVRRAIDARQKDIHFSYHIEVALDEPPQLEKSRLRRLRSNEAVWIEPKPEPQLRSGTRPMRERPLVVGFGPGGLFAALRLAQHGYRPIVVERGRDVRRRHRDILQRYYRERDFDPDSNLLFGEGGAGTYSDGKLYTRINDPHCRYVLETLYHHGASPDILIDTRPHVGSDRLPTLCVRMRQRIEALGGEVRFECQLDDIRIADGTLEAVRIKGEWVDTGPVILSIGHSARDTLRMLHRRGVRIDPKPFQIGVRIEHPQGMVDGWQYGAAAGHQRLAPAEYHMVAKGAGGEHGDMFSFCMCPGGMILPTNESAELIATNGASRSRRASHFANSGLVITLDPSTLGMTGVDGLAFQERWERLAFVATGRSYRVPLQRASDYLGRRPSDGTIETSFPLGGTWTDIRAVVPEQVIAALDKALPALNAKFPGFAGDEALIAAPETRASAPVRMVRDPQTREATATAGLYPIGEGAGYAGGIVSVAVDGIKTADRIIETYAPPG